MTKTTDGIPRFPDGTLLEERDRFAYLGSLLSGMIHNLNNPLGAVMGISQLMELRLPDDKDIPRLLKYIDELATQLRDITSKVQFEERLPRIDDLPTWLDQEMRFYRCHLKFKHGVVVKQELDAGRFPVIDVPGLPVTTFFFRFVEWMSGVIDHKKKAELKIRTTPEPSSPVLLLELQLVQPEAATASSLEDLIDLLAYDNIDCQLEIISDTDLTWQLTFPKHREQ
jgi:signal transduction histidine kinase